jgi:hypothetical protein
MKYEEVSSANVTHERDENVIRWSDGETRFGRYRPKGKITLRSILNKDIGINYAFVRAER